METYLFDCNEDLYGEYCKVDFKKFLRPEQKFSSLEALKAQLERDAVKGQEYFETFVKKRFTRQNQCAILTKVNLAHVQGPDAPTIS